MNKLIALTVGALFFMAAQGHSSESQAVDQVVAVVDGHPILRSELEGLRTSLSRQGEEISDLGLLLERRIEDLLLSSRAESLGIRIGEKEIDETVESIASQNEMTRVQLYEAIANQGLALLEYRRLLRDQMLRMQIIQKEIEPLVNIDQADLVAYMKANRDSYSSQPEVQLRILANAAVQASAITESIALVRPTTIEWGNLAPELQEWIANSPTPQSIRYFPSRGGNAGLWVQYILLQPAELRPLAEVENEVYERVRREKIERAFQHWFSELKARTWIDRFPHQ